jgi:hypothetical protein
MEYGIEWYREGTVLLVMVEGDVRFADMRRISDAIDGYLSAGTAPVHVVMEASQIAHFDTNVSGMKSSLRFLAHPALGTVVLVGANTMLATVSKVVTQVANVPLKVARSVEEAEAIIQEISAR